MLIYFKPVFCMLFFGIFSVFSLPAFAKEASIAKASFTLENNSSDGYTAHLILTNQSSQSFNHWKLAFNLSYPIQTITGAKITTHFGDYYEIEPSENNTRMLPPGGSVTFNIKGQWNIKNKDAAPRGYFLITQNDNEAPSASDLIDSETILPTWKPSAGEDDDSLNKNRNHTSIEGNPVTPTISLRESLIVPLPVELKRESGEFILQPNTTLSIDDNSHGAKEAAAFFIKAISPATGYSLPISSANNTSKNKIILTSQNAPKELGAEGYLLEVTPSVITIRAREDAGFFYALQSVRQLLPAEIFNQKKSANIVWAIPAVSIVDYPRFAYRGLQLDVARHFVPKDQVKRLLDLMAINKLNRFQWHLGDDEGWRIQINEYPALTEVGAWRGFNHALQPTFGSGPKMYGGFYTQEDIKEIVEYASERHITIIPEVDLPGHARALIKSLPEELVDPADRSVYTSVQGYHDNVLSPCIPGTYEVLNTIFSEVADLFPSEYIHVGSDEIPKGAWTGSPQCLALMKEKGLKNTEELQNYFLKQIEKILQEKNKKMAGWEEIIKGGDLGSNTLVYAWSNEQTGFDAASKGYPVIMAPAQNLYFDLAYSGDPEEYGQYWAGHVDTFNAYNYSPIPNNLPKPIAQKILGVEGALWSENIFTQDRLDYMAFPKVAALAELAWTPANRRNWINFSERLGHLYLPRLDQYGVNYRISQPGIDHASFQGHVLLPSIEFPGLAIRYTLDGSDPTMQSPLYTTPIKIPAIEKLKLRAFDMHGRGSRVNNSLS